MTAIPFFFGYSPSVFGWYHPALSSIMRACGVVLCPPLGHEYVCSYRAFRHLAERLAEAGFPVLRFDYSGTGNSAGGPESPKLVEAWRHDIGCAIDELRARADVDRVALVGLRMGATLAATVATERQDIESLVLWSPCPTGRSYVRQVKMLGMTTTERPDELLPEPEGIEAAGFMISAATAKALESLNLLAIPSCAASHVLLLNRDDLLRSDALAERLQACGAIVEERAWSGYATFMTSPVKSVFPAHVVDDITHWLSEKHPYRDRVRHGGDKRDHHTPVPAPTPPDYSHGESPRESQNVREYPVRFGHGLFGILTAPHHPERHKPALILLNTGGDHHIGPHRMYVPLAREWAARGFRVFRFDISGLGDSPARPGHAEGVVYPAGALDDLQDAIDHLRTYFGITRVVLIGICSGAYYAIHAARRGIPIDGNIAINPPLYWKEGDPPDGDPYWNEYETQRVGRAILVPAKWGRLLRGRVDVRYTLSLLGTRVKLVARGVGHAVLDLMGVGRAREREEDLLAFFPDRVESQLIFSHRDPGLSYVMRHNGAMDRLRRRANFSLQVIEGADHTFMPVRWQRHLAELLTDRTARIGMDQRGVA